jgi:hypothetical protein
MHKIRVAYLVVLWLSLLAVVIQFFLAGLGIFEETSFDAHETLGFILHIPVAGILLILALIGVRPLANLVLAIVYSILLFLQPFWVDPFGDDTRWVAALHVLLPAFILGIGFALSARLRPVVWGPRSPVIAPPR